MGRHLGVFIAQANLGLGPTEAYRAQTHPFSQPERAFLSLDWGFYHLIYLGKYMLGAELGWDSGLQLLNPSPGHI